MTAQERDPAALTETFIRTGLDQVGIPVDEAELAVMMVVDGLYRPRIQALLETELDDVVPEPGADLSKPPRP